MVIWQEFFIHHTMVTVADSIGIKLISPNCLLTGIGNELHQYYIDSNQCTVHRQIGLSFRSKIYGIASYDGSNEEDTQFIVVYAGREVAILQLKCDKQLEITAQLTLNDWISSIRVYKPVSNEEVSFCVVTAHSVVSEFRVDTNGKWNIRHKASCVDKCTLYSSLIVGDEWDETTIFGGTAFGELIIWIAKGDDAPRKVLQRVSGHNGVIFSINCSLKHNLITTTSDDRSVKIWDLKFPTNKIDWVFCSIEPTKSMFGHTARIFSHKIIESNSKVFIITVGEEGNVCVWSPDGRLVNRIPVAANVSLWNLDYDSKRQYLFASGNDGNVHQMNLKNILNETQYSCEEFGIIGCDKGEYIEKLAIMQEDAMVVMLTNRQKLFYERVNKNISWNPMPGAETDYKIAVLETFGSLVATAGYEYITIYQLENDQFTKVYHDKLAGVDNAPMLLSLKFLSERQFVICDVRGAGSLISIDKSFKITNKQSFKLPPCKERWITVAARFLNYLVIGDRHGNMHLYQIEDEVVLKHTLWHVHGNLGCKSIFRTSAKNQLQFECAGHQSKVKTIVINDITHELELKSTNEIPIKWCDKSLHADELGNVLLAGFNERHFVAWRYDDSYRFEFDCGGGHRACDLFVDRKLSKAYLFFVRNKLLNRIQFHLHDDSMHPFSIVKNNWHSRPCNTMRIIQLTSERFLIASGGDDNLLKFSEINTLDPTKLQHDRDMVLHISNIRSIFSLRLSNDGSDCGKWLIFSAGGRAQICVTEVQLDQRQAVEFYEVCDFMLRSSDLERKQNKQTQIIYFDPETRFMSLVAYHNENDICVAVGCSDGFIRTFRYIDGTICLDTSVFYGRCFLHIYHFAYNNEHFLITMATDGLISFWSLDNLNENSKPFFVFQHHESGINAFDILIEADKLFIATGGDDQAIVVSILDINDVSESECMFTISKTKKYEFDHTAQVNGVKFSNDKKYLYTTSVDQSVMRVDLSDFSIKQAGYSCVSDAKGLHIVDSNHILVYGCGMQVMKT